MSDSNPPAEPNRNRKRKSDSSTPSSSFRPPQPEPIPRGSSAQSSSSITVEDVTIGWRCRDGNIKIKDPYVYTSGEEESHDSSNTPSSSSRPPQPALIFYPHWNHAKPIETLRSHNKQLFDETLRMQTEMAKGRKHRTSLSTSSHTQSLGDGATRSEPNNRTVQIVNMMKDQHQPCEQKFCVQLNTLVNPLIPIDSIKIFHNLELGITHYEALQNIPPDIRDSDSDEKLQARDHPPRANQNMATANTSHVESKSIFPSGIQGIPPYTPSPPGCVPFPGLYHDEHNPVTDEIFDKYFRYLQDCLTPIFPPPNRNLNANQNMAPATSYSIPYVPPNASDYNAYLPNPLDEQFSQNVSGGHESGTSSDTRQHPQLHYNYSGCPQSSSAGRYAQNAPEFPGRRSNTRQGDISSAPSEALTDEAIIKHLNRPRGDREIFPSKILKEVLDFINKNEGTARGHISQMVGKGHTTLNDQTRTYEPKQYFDYNCNLQEFYLRLFNWLEYDNETRKAVLARREELKVRWSEIDKQERQRETL